MDPAMVLLSLEGAPRREGRGRHREERRHAAQHPVLRAAGGGRESQNTPDEAAQRWEDVYGSAFMSASLMNETPVSPGEMGPSAGCFIDSSPPSRRRNEASVRACARAGEREESVDGGGIDAAICDGRQCG